MKKQTKQIIGIIVAVIFLIVLFGQLKLQTLYATQGYQFIKNTNDPTSNYSLILPGGSSFTCQNDECIVSGAMTVSKNLGGTGTKYYCPRLIDGTKEAYTMFDSATTCDSSPNWKYNKLSGGTIISSTCNQMRLSCVATAPPPVYKATFNFCSTLDNVFPSCSGVYNTVMSESASQTYYTEEMKLVQGQSITFFPKNGDGSDISDRSIRVRLYDGSCIPAVKAGTACESSQIKCGASSFTCPIGTTFCPNTIRSACVNIDGTGSSSNIYRNICHGIPTCGSYSSCFTPITTYSKYYKCDATQVIGASTCGKFGTTTYDGPTGQQCFLLSSTGQLTTTQGEGLGGFACKTDACYGGQKTGTTGDTTYQECINLPGSNCNGYAVKYCETGLIYDDTVKDCVCNPTNSCVPNSVKCTGTKELTRCVSSTVGGKTCYNWALSPEICSGDLMCSLNNPDIDDDSCSCSGVDKCTRGQIKCISENYYQECKTDTNNPASCLDYRGNILVPNDKTCNVAMNTLSTKPGCLYTPSLCTADEDCVDNVCKPKTTGDYCTAGSASTCPDTSHYKKCVLQSGTIYKWVTSTCSTGQACKEGACVASGCSYPTNPNYVNCTKLSSLSSCVNNKCVCSTENQCTEADSVNNIKNCGLTSGSLYNTVQKCVKYGNCYRWETDISEVDTINGVCKNEFVCSESAGSAKCTPTFNYIGITSTNSYGIGEMINGVKVQVTSQVPNYQNVLVTGRLLDGTQEVGNRISIRTGIDGTAEIDFNYARDRIGTLTIEVIAGDPTTSPYKTSKSITISNKIDLKLSCDITAFVNRDITCTWLTKDANTGSVISTDITRSIIQGTTEILFVSSGINGVTFKTGTLGSVTVNVGASKEGYISDEETTIVNIQKTQLKQILYIDNKDFLSYASGTVDTGNHQIKMALEESGLPAEIQSINAYIKEPSGRDVEVIFNQQSGAWIGNYNFIQAGQVYKLYGEIVFKDFTKQNEPFAYSISTTSTLPDDVKTSATIYIIIGAITFIVVIISIVLFIVLRKRRK